MVRNADVAPRERIGAPCVVRRRVDVPRPGSLPGSSTRSAPHSPSPPPRRHSHERTCAHPRGTPRPHPGLQQGRRRPRRDAAAGLLARRQRHPDTRSRADRTRGRTHEGPRRTARRTAREGRPRGRAAGDAQGAHGPGPRTPRGHRAGARTAALRTRAALARSAQDRCGLPRRRGVRRPAGTGRRRPRARARPAAPRLAARTGAGHGHRPARTQVPLLPPRGGAYHPLPPLHAAEEDRGRTHDLGSHAAAQARAVLGARQRAREGAAARGGARLRAGPQHRLERGAAHRQGRRDQPRPEGLLPERHLPAHQGRVPRARVRRTRRHDARAAVQRERGRRTRGGRRALLRGRQGSRPRAAAGRPHEPDAHEHPVPPARPPAEGSRREARLHVHALCGRPHVLGCARRHHTGGPVAAPGAPRAARRRVHPTPTSNA